MMRYPPVWNMLYILCASKNEAEASEAAVALMGKIDQIVRENSEKIFQSGRQMHRLQKFPMSTAK